MDQLATNIQSTIYTIGHGNRAADEFSSLLIASNIASLVDVRAFPGSRRHPQFGRAELQRTLAAAGIQYVWEGASLGGRRKPRSDSLHTALRHPSFRAYADHMETAEFRDGIVRLLQLASSMHAAIMCAERLPWQCHRYMISDFLVAGGLQVRHLIGQGAARDHTLRAEARVSDSGLVYDVGTQGDFALE